MKPTSTYLNDRATFTYELKIRINSRNYLERIIAFEKAFLVLGEASGLFVAVPFKTEAYLNMEPLLEKYEKERFLSMEQRKTEAVTLLNFEESKYFRNRVAFVGLDLRGAELEDGIPVAPVDTTDPLELRSAAKMMQLVTVAGPLYEDLMDEFYWEEYLTVRVKSHANVWLEEIVEEGVVRDNRAVAETMVPVFNGFLQKLRALAEAENGSLTLTDAASELVTEAGVLLGGKIIVE